MRELHRRAVLARLAGWPVKTIAAALRVRPHTVQSWLRLYDYSVREGWQRGGYVLGARGAEQLDITAEDSRRLGANAWECGTMESADTPRRVRGLMMRPGPGMHTAWLLFDD